MVLKENFDTTEALLKSIERSRKFIIESLNSDGLWSDFFTLAGESVFWVSGYVGFSLVTFEKGSEEKKLLEKAMANILNLQGSDGGWSYGYGVPSDADSTSWCLLFLSKFETLSREKLQKALDFLLKHQSPFDGGFRTYAAPRAVGRYMRIDENVSFEGWASSQMCVSAVAAQALMENHSLEGIDKALSYIRNGQTSEGYWNSYWWTGKLYATSHSIEALNKKGNEDDINLITKGQKWIAQTQLSDGSWTDSPDQESGWAFSTALALNGLLATPQTIFDAQTKSGVKWLIEHQLPDGSWAPNHILRIPYPWTKDPWNQQSWNVDGKAINAVIKDHRRLFTAATAFTALNQYKKRMLEDNTF
jgi:squalene-hopene/tetraprenyl-beta-curcumene cyclase